MEVLRVEERLRDDLRADETAEQPYLDPPPRLDLARWEVGVRDRPSDAVAVPAARDTAHGPAVDPHRLRTKHDHARVVEDETCEPASRRPGGQRASRPMKGTSLCIRTAKPRPASKGVSAEVTSLPQTR